MELFTKEVDKSLLKEGFSVPVQYQEKFLKALHINLYYGDTCNIKISIDSVLYDAELKNQKYNKEKYPNHAPIIQIRYSPNSDIAKKLRKIFSASNYYIEKHCDNKKKRKIIIPNEEKEYVKIVLPKEKNILTFEYHKVSGSIETEIVTNIETDILKNIAIEHSKVREKRNYTVEREIINRNQYIAEYAKRIANGICQLCRRPVPFLNKEGKPYLEEHHIKWLSKGGFDSIDNVVALCPNCHRKMHVLNKDSDIQKLKKLIT